MVNKMTYEYKYNKLKELRNSAIDLLDEVVKFYGDDDVIRDAHFGREWMEIVAHMEEIVDVMSNGNILITQDDAGMYDTIAVLLRRYRYEKLLVFIEYLHWRVINPNWDQLNELLQLQEQINTKTENLIQYVNRTR